MTQRTRARTEYSAGGVLFRCTVNGPRYLLILDSYRNWGFPKGHLDNGETPEAAARREVAEETGLSDLILHEPLGQIDWYFRFRGRVVHKFCHFFLFEAPTGTPEPQQAEGISDCRWYPIGDALDRIAYANARGVLRRAASHVPAVCEDAHAVEDAVG